MLFEEGCGVWTERRLTQEDAAELLGVCPRTFRRWTERCGEDGIDGLRDRRLSGASHRAAPVDEVMRMVDRYRTRHEGWSVRHFYSWRRRDGGERGHGWVKDKLQQAGAAPRSKGRGRRRKRRERSPWPGMPPHQDGGGHEWVEGRRWDLIVTMDDATSEHCSMLLCGEEGLRSSFPGRSGDDRGQGPVPLALHGPGPALLDDAGGGREGGPGEPDAVRPGDGPSGDRDDPGLPAGGAGTLGAGVRRPPRPAAEGVGAGRGDGPGLGQPLLGGGVHAGLQRGVRAAGAGFGFGVRALPGPGGAGRRPVRGSRAHRGAGQLRALRGAGPAVAGGPASAPLREGQGEGPPPCRTERPRPSRRRALRLGLRSLRSLRPRRKARLKPERRRLQAPAVRMQTCAAGSANALPAPTAAKPDSLFVLKPDTSICSQH